MRTHAYTAVLVAATSLLCSPLAATVVRGLGSGDAPSAPHFRIEGQGDERAASSTLPLKSSRADVRIAGVIAHVRVTQTWHNAGRAPLDVTYVFPGSTRAAVFGMRMKIGDRTLEAKIDERAAAQKLYERARREGRTASLLQQHRPNVFEMSVANILPGDTIDVELDYTELLVPELGVYELVYPQVVGPRYSRGAEPEEQGWLDNPFVARPVADEMDWGVDIELSASMPIQQLGSPTHALSTRYTARTTALVTAGGREGGGDRDFVFRYRLAGDEIETGVLLFRDNKRGENFFLMMVQPPKDIERREMPPREVVFVVDVSGSMQGFPLDTSKQLMRNLLASMRPQDTFNLIFFASGSYLLSDSSLPATRENIERALSALEHQRGGGGTNLDQAIERALDLPTDTRTTSRNIALITDGYVSFEDTVFDLVRARARDANVFAFGIGSSVNRHLIEGVARAGLGEPWVVLNDREAKAKAAAFQRAISRPALTGVKVAYEGFKAYDVEPSAPVDLLADRPLLLFGKYRGAASGRIKVSGYAGGHQYAGSVEVEDHLEKPAHEALRYLWARARVSRLDGMGRPAAAAVAKVTGLGLKYNLLTRYTSFVAIDSQVRNPSRVLPQARHAAPPRDFSATGSSSFGFAAAPPTSPLPRQARRTSPPPKSKRHPNRVRRSPDPIMDFDAGDVGQGGARGLKRALSPTDVLTVIRKNLGTVNRCGREHGVKGQVKMEWRILKSGRASSVRVMSPQYVNTPVGRCLVSAIKKWRFDKFTGPPPPPVKFPFKLKG